MASKRTPPPARVSEKKMKLAKEMLSLIDALPPSPEKEKLLLHDQYAEWEYHRDECKLKSYTHNPTQEEKVAGVTKDAQGKDVKLWKKATWCHHCKCSAQEFKRHRKSKKCMTNRAKTTPHREAIHQAFNNRLKGEGTSEDYDMYMNMKCNNRSAPNLQMYMEEKREERELQEMTTEDKPKKKKKTKILKLKKRLVVVNK